MSVFRRDVDDRDLPQLLETVARFLRSGSSLPVALREASEDLDEALRRELAMVLAGADHGRPLADAFAEWARASASPARQMVAAAMVIGAVDPSMASAVVQSGTGQLCLVGGLVCEVAGLGWIRRLSRRAA
jgi:Flp pilus assembly protein TadB